MSIFNLVPHDIFPELQIRGGIEDNLKIIFYFSSKIYGVTPHYNHLGEMNLMMGHTIC